MSSDAADLASDVAKMLCAGKPLVVGLWDLLLFRLGGVQPIVVFLHGFVARLLDISVEPTTWEWSTIVVSSGSAPLAFLAGRRFGGVGGGWAWAVFVAISPIHVMLGRNLGAPWAYEVSFQLALLWLLDRHLTVASRKSAAALWSTLGAYFWCGNQMMAIVPVLGYAFLAHTWDRPTPERLKFLRSRLLSWWLWMPVVSAVVLAYCTFVLERGHLHHALFEKRKTPGWHWDNFYSDMVQNLGYVPAWVCLLAFAVTLLAPLPLLDKRRIPLVYALCYVLPFVFLVSRATTLTRGYSVYGLTGLLGLVALLPSVTAAVRGGRGLPFFSRYERWVNRAVHISTALTLAAATGASVYKFYPGKGLGVKGFQGSFGPPIGVAAASGFIARLSTLSGAPAGRVFSDAYGGKGLEPPLMRLYFKRPHFALYDARRMAPWKAFSSKASNVGFAVIRPENAKLVGKHFPGLELAARIVSDASDKELLLVYVRGYEETPQRLSAEEGVRIYAESFLHFCAR